MSDPVQQIGEGTRVRGKLRVDGDVHVAGTVEGQLAADGEVLVQRTGVVRAEISARRARIEGTVIGDVHAIESVEIMAGGRLEGNVAAPRVLLREGAQLLGQIASAPQTMREQAQEGAREAETALPPARPVVTFNEIQTIDVTPVAVSNARMEQAISRAIDVSEGARSPRPKDDYRDREEVTTPARSAVGGSNGKRWTAQPIATPFRRTIRIHRRT